MTRLVDAYHGNSLTEPYTLVPPSAVLDCANGYVNSSRTTVRQHNLRNYNKLAKMSCYLIPSNRLCKDEYCDLARILHDSAHGNRANAGFQYI